ncbi:MAG: hypothetical protein KGJ57_19325 [Sphingomonadales bacterium]|nr:hypothetical protein [Sphingomonadales bacterium]MDE2171547.1 hypothetical protein [Sphingomonadales bacterium]
MLQAGGHRFTVDVEMALQFLTERPTEQIARCIRDAQSAMVKLKIFSTVSIRILTQPAALFELLTYKSIRK